MGTRPLLRLTFILFIIILLFTCSWYSLNLPVFSDPPQATSWLCNSESRVFAHLGSVLETEIHKPRDHMEDVPHHPLDPLTMREIYKVRTILSTYPPLLPSFPAIHSLSLDEPHKDLVLKWKEGDPLPPRKALVIALLNGQSHVLCVDLDLGLADQRAGIVISRAMVSDSETGVPRSVMYKGFSSELFVPYMDPDENWYFKSYMDAGEFGMGATALSLVPLNDCPRHSYYMDGIFVSWDGKPYVQPSIICLFERYAGDISWRHSEIPVNGFNIREARPKVSLVARMAASVGNYDYIFDWEFQTDGLIHVAVALSGMLMVKGTPHQTADQTPNQEAASGPLISENLIGVVHDHFITFHLDMDIDDTNNTFVKVNLVKEETLPGQSPRKSYLKAKRNTAKTEDDARIKLKLYEPSEFHVINPSRRSRLGNPAGYKIVPGRNAASLLDHLDPPQLRSAFTNNQIWVTPYNRNEQWAGGLFTYQSKGDDTLAAWSKSVSLVLFFTWVHLPYAPQPNSTTDLLDCSTNSPWCTSKNRFQPINKPSTADKILEKPPNPKHRNHEADTPHHPLDPLTISEINKVRTILKSHTLFKSSSPCAFHSIVLEEPDKTLVLKWKKGDSMLPRKAAVVARVAGKSYVLTVDISSGEVAVQETGSRSGYPTMTIEDMTSSTWAPLSNADFNRTIIERGVELQDLACLPISLDSGEMRNVMYKGYTSELFVPYMDPTDAWYFKTYMDAGEYGFGLQAMPLDPLNDCPRNAYYMDGVFAAGDGTPYVRSHMVCVFESYAGDIGWRHSESPITD
ncbi:hypothetical protein D5086_001060 [Populus alba]|uniref:Uncharacterized protein n=1 Tax=Populus alba TaxID=43335 RepID=A0ACC4CXU7_POPAL